MECCFANSAKALFNNSCFSFSDAVLISASCADNCSVSVVSFNINSVFSVVVFESSALTPLMASTDTANFAFCASCSALIVSINLLSDCCCSVVNLDNTVFISVDSLVDSCANCSAISASITFLREPSASPFNSLNN